MRLLGLGSLDPSQTLRYDQNHAHAPFPWPWSGSHAPYEAVSTSTRRTETVWVTTSLTVVLSDMQNGHACSRAFAVSPAQRQSV